MGGIYEARRGGGVKWHDIRVHTKLHDDWFLIQAILKFCLSNSRRSNAGISTGGGIYEVCLEIASYGMIYLPSFMEIGSGIRVLLPQQFERLQCWLFLMGRIYEV
jgi:hypothetical protein